MSPSRRAVASTMALFVLLASCTQITGTKPPSTPCHGDTVTVSFDSLSVDSAIVVHPHVCGTPRGS